MYVVGAGIMKISIVPMLLIDDRRRTTDARGTENQEPRTTQRVLDREPTTGDNREARNQKSEIKNLKSKIPDFWRDIIVRPGPLVRLLIPPLLISFGAALLIPYLNLYFKQRFA